MKDAVAQALRTMEGTWEATQQMWGGPDTNAAPLPPATVRRHMLAETTLLEEMELSAEAEPLAFRRTAVLNFNPVSQRFEYFSIDSRAPQAMLSRSEVLSSPGFGIIEFDGGDFTAPEWGSFRNTVFHYRVSLTGIGTPSQTFRLLLTPRSGSLQEFLAFEYNYRQT